jgi:lysophospholipase L1-like esterase
MLSLAALPSCAVDDSYSSAEWILKDPYYQRRVSHFRALPPGSDELIFVGDSITDGAEWAELTGLRKVINRGISGDTAWGLLPRIDEITSRHPRQLVLSIGTNDIAWGRKSVAEVRAKVGEVLDAVRAQSPATPVILQSVLPVIDGRRESVETSKVAALNRELESLAGEKSVTWLDLTPALSDSSGQLRPEFTNDGLHLTGAGYAKWVESLRPLLVP